MTAEPFSFSDTTARTFHALLWTPSEPPSAVLQITHGMTEHIGRYHALAEALVSRGIAVAGFDLRGHGSCEGN
ncbi:MAG: alpha/beta hydrolase, partial [Clostridia bacterium]|nr:alpha/beta hydrolase [Clostridia bacterium]